MRASLILLLTILIAGWSSTSSGLTGKEATRIIGKKNFLTGYPAMIGEMVQVVVEIPAGTSQKWEVSKDGAELLWKYRNGKLRVVDYLAYPGNYGMVPQTLLSKESGGDGDPVDVMVLGESIERGKVVSVRVIDVLKVLDDGENDHKLIAVQTSGPLANVQDMNDLRENYPGAAEILYLWFKNYKGPGESVVLGYGGRKQAMRIVTDAMSDFSSRLVPGVAARSY